MSTKNNTSVGRNVHLAEIDPREYSPANNSSDQRNGRGEHKPAGIVNRVPIIEVPNRTEKTRRKQINYR